MILVINKMMKKNRETRQKELISQAVERTENFFSAEDIFDQVKKQDASIGIATVYRFLKDLREKNKIYSYLCERKMLYSKEKKSHCHYICERTGKITHFELDNLDFLKNLRSKIPGSINSFQIEIKGICRQCD